MDKGHGRIERRQYWYTHDVAGLGTLERWPSLQGMVMCRATRTIKGKSSTEDRYFITSSKDKPIKTMASSCRARWGVENGLHWVIDVAFGEDQCRIRNRYAAENLATIRRAVINVIKNNTSKKGGVKAKRLQAAWNTEYLRELFMAM